LQPADIWPGICLRCETQRANIRNRFLPRDMTNHSFSTSVFLNLGNDTRFGFNCNTRWHRISYNTLQYIEYNTVYLTCSKKLTNSQLSLPHERTKNVKEKLKIKKTKKTYTMYRMLPFQWLQVTQIPRSQYLSTSNKCFGDDTKAAARQSPNCIRKTKK